MVLCVQLRQQVTKIETVADEEPSPGNQKSTLAGVAYASKPLCQNPKQTAKKRLTANLRMGNDSKSIREYL